jgi:ketosteroid isomerase-like protein
MNNFFRSVSVSVSLLSTFILAPAVIGADVVSLQGASGNEQAIWNLEHTYWTYVQANDLVAYLNLWDESFLGWPATNSAPVSKDHITDWITSRTGRGLTFRTGEFRPAGIRVNGDLASVCYWITYQWVGKDGSGPEFSLRVTHAWKRTGTSWHIISGMSMLVPEPAKSNAPNQSSEPTPASVTRPAVQESRPR